MKAISVLAGLAGLVAFAANVLAAGCPTSPRNPINPPRHDRPAAASRFSCATVPPPVSVLTGEPFYTDPKASVIDRGELAVALQTENAVRSYTAQLTRMSNLLVAQGDGSQVYDCLTAWLSDWAANDALLRSETGQGNLFRIWALVPIAMSVSILKSSPSGYDDPKVDRWLKALAERGWDHVRRTHTVNNIKDWAAAGSAFAYVATGDCALFEAAIQALRDGIAAVDYRGFLTTEIGRGRRALSYQSFALTPLALAAEVAYANGVDVFGENRSALRRAAQKIIEADTSTQAFEEAAGAPQDVSAPLPSGQFIWAAILARHYDDDALKAILAKKRPFVFDRAGGDNLLLFGARH